MRYSKKFKDKRYEIKRKNPGLDDYEIKDSGTPEEPNKGETSSTLQKRALKDLSFLPITVQANPTVQATRSTDPYAPLNRNNSIIDASYPGNPTLSGNTVMQLLNNNNTKLLNIYDAANLQLRLNYLYLAIDGTAKNKALNYQMGSVINEALSFGSSEQMTQLPFYTEVCSSTMPSNDTINKLPQLVFYETMLLNTAAIPAKYLQMRALENELKMMSFNREAPFINDLYGRFKKTAFIAVINGISEYTAGEYFDTYWFKQMNTLCNVPSRKSESMSDPLLTICAVHKVPDITITSFGASSPYVSTSLYTTTVDGVEYTAEELCMEILNRMDACNILTWARQRFNGMTDVTDTDYFNATVRLLEAYKTMMTRFSSDMATTRTFLDLMTKTGLCAWERGKYFNINGKVEPLDLKNNVLCNNVFSAYLASSDTMIYDNNTMRWKFYSLWNQYYGIPQYDMRDGGSFLTFSLRNLPNESGEGAYTGTKWLIPKLFDVALGSVYAVSRLGYTSNIDYEVYDQNAIDSSPVLSRLNPLRMPDLAFRVPSVDLIDVANQPAAASAMYRFMSNTLGHGQVRLSSSVKDVCVSSDSFCFIDIEMDDISNAMISFARAYSPFRVASNDVSPTVGFLNVKTSSLA